VFYVFHGPDELTRTEAVADMKAHMGEPAMADLNTTYLDGQTVTLSDIQQACNALPFLCNHRLVVVKGYLSRLWGDGKGSAEKAMLQALSDYLATLPDTAMLIFIEEQLLPGSHPILVLAERKRAEGGVQDFKVPSREDDLTAWVRQRVEGKGASIERAAARALALTVGHDTRLLDSEIEKLITYVGGPQPAITADHIDLLVPYTGEANVFAMVDAIGRRDARHALQHLHKLLDDNPIENHPLKLLQMIVRQFRILIQVKELIMQDLAISTVAKQLGLPGFVAEKARQQAMSFSMAQMQAIYGRLLSTDLAIKTGKMEDVLALDTLVAALCGPQE
jgi:DNA polymerase III subunit delta